MIGDGAGLFGWYVGFGIGIGGCFLYGMARGVAAALAALNAVPRPEPMTGWDPWDHPALIAAEEAERR